jgi:hypothetical protein
VVAAGGIPVPLALVQSAFGFTMAVPNLPMGSRVTTVEVRPDGLRVSATAQDVNIATIPAPTPATGTSVP